MTQQPAQPRVRRIGKDFWQIWSVQAGAWCDTGTLDAGRIGRDMEAAYQQGLVADCQRHADYAARQSETRQPPVPCRSGGAARDRAQAMTPERDRRCTLCPHKRAWHRQGKCWWCYSEWMASTVQEYLRHEFTPNG